MACFRWKRTLADVGQLGDKATSSIRAVLLGQLMGEFAPTVLRLCPLASCVPKRMLVNPVWPVRSHPSRATVDQLAFL